MLIAHVLALSCWRKKLQNLFNLNCGLQITRFEPSWLQCVGYVTKGIQNTHHWSGQNERATENGMGQAGSRRHFGVHWMTNLVITSASVQRSQHGEWPLLLGHVWHVYDIEFVFLSTKELKVGWFSFGWLMYWPLVSHYINTQTSSSAIAERPRCRVG